MTSLQLNGSLIAVFFATAVFCAAGMGSDSQPTRHASHPATRAMVEPPFRPMAAGPAYFVNASQGDDEQDGTIERPWKTIQHALGELQPGDTLYLREGTYFESYPLTKMR
jgi:hypothetical protein